MSPSRCPSRPWPSLLAAQQQGKLAVEASTGSGQPVSGVLNFVDNAVNPQAGKRSAPRRASPTAPAPCGRASSRPPRSRSRP
ncbi:hypothetical protein LP419_16410 [Massilia sp. H-1]|nr:hypothetical protein LP419_16410 [Massilia sp. H-1]